MIWSQKQSWKVIIILSLVAFVLWNYWLLTEPEPVVGGDTAGLDDPGDPEPPAKVTLAPVRATPTSHPHTTSSFTIPASHPTNSSYPRYEDLDENIITYGRIQPGYNYSVFSSTVHGEQSLNYLFDLPLAALAWERIGFRSIVLLVMDVKKVYSSEKFKYVLSTLFDLRAVVVVLNSHSNFAVMVSQVSRLFVPYLVNKYCIEDESAWLDTYLVTSDADLWPLDKDAFFLPDNDTDILCLNAHCCGDFVHNFRSYSMLPIGSIGMRVWTWRSVARRHGFVPLGVDGIIKYLTREFGVVATSQVEKGENLGWFMDQRLVTVLIHDWSERYANKSRVRYVRRDVGRDRIDRTSWRPYTLDHKVDSHVLESAYQPRNWHRLESLLVLMYDTQLFHWCKNYAHTFQSLP